MMTTLIRRWFSTGLSLIVKGTLPFFMDAPSRSRLGSVAGSEERHSTMSADLITTFEGCQVAAVKSKELFTVPSKYKCNIWIRGYFRQDA